MRAIFEAYDEYIVDFIHINQWELLDSAIQKLSGVDWGELCAGSGKLIVYGYGDPIGGDEATRQVSAGRARSVANWIVRNSTCREEDLLTRGLGVDVKAGEILEADLPRSEKEKLYRKSRYTRILVPRKEQ